MQYILKHEGVNSKCIFDFVYLYVPSLFQTHIRKASIPDSYFDNKRCLFNHRMTVNIAIPFWEKRWLCVFHTPKVCQSHRDKQTDKKYSKWIVALFKFGLLSSSFSPPEDFRQLYELCKVSFKLVCMKASEKNRLPNHITASNIDSILSVAF